MAVFITETVIFFLKRAVNHCSSALHFSAPNGLKTFQQSTLNNLSINFILRKKASFKAIK